MRFSSSAIAVAVFAASAAARIVDLLPYPGTYQASNSSVFPLTFSTENSQSPYREWSAAVGLSAAEVAAPEALGTWITNIDFVAIHQDVTGTGNFSVLVSLPASSFTRGAGNYVITAAILQSYGAAWNTGTIFVNTTFPVTIASGA